MKKDISKKEVKQEEIQPVSIEEIILAGAEERVKMVLLRERGDYLNAKEALSLNAHLRTRFRSVELQRTYLC